MPLHGSQIPELLAERQLMHMSRETTGVGKFRVPPLVVFLGADSGLLYPIIVMLRILIR